MPSEYSLWVHLLSTVHQDSIPLQRAPFPLQDFIYTLHNWGN
jgi:hypothetical protein